MNFGPVSGRELAAQVSSTEFKVHCSRFVAQSPGRALDAIARQFGSRPAPDGHNNPAISEIRRLLATLVKDNAALNGLMITAPHSHWDDGRPIIVRFGNGRYTIGPTDVEPEEAYIPVSFALTSEGPLAYEWADTSIDLAPEEVSATHALVQQANEVFGTKGWPFGLALAFRFKTLFAPQSVSAVEYTFEDLGSNEEDGIILTRAELEQLVPDAGYAQVGWHAFADETEGLSTDASEAVKLIRALAQGMSEQDRHSLRDLIERQTRA
jgi:hypothetical protein